MIWLVVSLVRWFVCSFISSCPICFVSNMQLFIFFCYLLSYCDDDGRTNERTDSIKATLSIKSAPSFTRTKVPTRSERFGKKGDGGNPSAAVNIYNNARSSSNSNLNYTPTPCCIISWHSSMNFDGFKVFRFTKEINTVWVELKYC